VDCLVTTLLSGYSMLLRNGRNTLLGSVWIGQDGSIAIGSAVLCVAATNEHELQLSKVEGGLSVGSGMMHVGNRP
jgi:hypothetical protein